MTTLHLKYTKQIQEATERTKKIRATIKRIKSNKILNDNRTKILNTYGLIFKGE